MSYTPNTWQTGDTITATKLNNMEQGIANAGGGALLVTVGFAQDRINFVLDKTWQEIYDALLSGGVTILRREFEGEYEYNTVCTLLSISIDSEVGHMMTISDTDYFAASADGYPQTNFS